MIHDIKIDRFGEKFQIKQYVDAVMLAQHIVDDYIVEQRDTGKAILMLNDGDMNHFINSINGEIKEVL